MRDYDFNDKNDVFDFVTENYNEISTLNDRLNRDYLEQQMSNILQRREFMKHITLLSGAILAFMPLIANDVQLKSLFFLSIGFHFLVIFSVLAIIRDIIDKEALEFGQHKEEYNKMFGKDLNLHRDFLATGDYTKDKLMEYFDKRRQTSEDFNNRLQKTKQEQKSKEGLWDFTLDIIIFFFTSALALLLLAVVLPSICWQLTVLILFGLFMLSLFMPVLKVMELMSRPLSRIKNLIDKKLL